MVMLGSSENAAGNSAHEMQRGPRPRVLVADDHEYLLRRVTSLLNSEFEVVGTVNDGRALVAEARRLRPDLILLDISMPVMNGIEAAREIHAALPSIKLVFLTAHADSQFVRACFAEGGLGYVTKLDLRAHLITAINAALAGNSFISPSVPTQHL